MEISKNEFKITKYFAYLGVSVIDIILGCVCVKSNMPALPKYLITGMIINHEAKNIGKCLREITVDGVELKVK